MCGAYLFWVLPEKRAVFPKDAPLLQPELPALLPNPMPRPGGETEEEKSQSLVSKSLLEMTLCP